MSVPIFTGRGVIIVPTGSSPRPDVRRSVEFVPSDVIAAMLVIALLAWMLWHAVSGWRR